jgi:DNA-binding XRE family transcriptional regulator
MSQFKITTHDEMKDKLLGKIGTPERDAYEAKLAEEVEAYQIGEALKQARLSKQLTQEQLGDLIGVKKSQVSKIESGRNLTLTTISRVFKALDIKATLSIGGTNIAIKW